MVEADPLVRVRLDVSYDGTDFAGWAVQPGRRTVQGVLEAALCTVLRQSAVPLTVAGRTDAGVHATGQVAHCDILPPAADLAHRPDPVHRFELVHRLARLLPADVRVRAAREVPPDFDARFSALWRRYEYRIGDASWGVHPLRARYVLAWPRGPLDAEAMAGAGARLLGLHDFAAFCRRREGATTLRTLQDLSVRRDGDEITCTVVADAFCHSMVRSLVGALITVGEGRRPAAWPASLLERDRRANEVPVAPAHGLTLTAVGYPPDAELAERAAVTRAKRDRGAFPVPGAEKAPGS